ncbi:hypothetical protein P7K49_004220, partial [Saguinus oedipus]
MEEGDRGAEDSVDAGECLGRCHQRAPATLGLDGPDGLRQSFALRVFPGMAKPPERGPDSRWGEGRLPYPGLGMSRLAEGRLEA